jgi:hypothetical protein
MTPQTKTDKARALFARGEYGAAFAIFRGFNLVFTKPEIRTLEIAHESLTGKAGFYQTLKIDTDRMIAEAKQLIIKKYGNDNN